MSAYTTTQEQFEQYWPRIPRAVQTLLKNIARHTSVRQDNTIFAMGYIAALVENKLIDAEIYEYLLVILGLISDTNTMPVNLGAVRIAI